MNKTLTTLFALAVASVTAFSHAQEAKGDVEAGKQKIAMCIGCHGIVGYQASFPEIHKVPMISGQSAKFITAALVAYQKGERKHPTMRGIAESLSEKDIADVSAYYEQHGKTGAELPAKPGREPSVQVAELLKKGACVSCHGDNFAKPIDPSYPKIAGQHADYLFVALKSYKVEKNANVGRNNAIMGGVAKQFTNAELKALANYISSVDGDLHVVPQSRFR
ncbi:MULTISPECIES: c-type cytochrome [Acidovorax]|uniref:c-type cytochrome n=1 Tax=Acidovorax TaxID=12916 RepID=UPI0007B50B31|nr:MULTISPECIES: c-type cytochrome [Acidovorax]KZT17616.1 cytochrome C [Acidovorax sp. GW101-3H11]MCO5356078.1 cytochrome c4 [Acidovorax kalamii]